MKIRLIWPESSSEKDFVSAIDRYVQRIRHFYPIEVVDVAGQRGRQSQSDASIMRGQSARLFGAIPDPGPGGVLDERGQTFDSLKFARWLERLTIDSPHGIHFVVGGDVGLDETIKRRADVLLSLSPMTLPHQIARVVLLEQIYRACTLMRNIRYHK